MLRLGVVPDAARAKHLERRLLQLVHAAPPLEGDERLDPALAALADGDRMAVRLALLEQAALLAPGEHERPRLLLRQPGDLGHDVVHAAVGADHHRLGQAVRAADLEVGGVVPGGDLERAGAELGLDALVRDDRHPPLDEGDDGFFADQMAISLVVGVHRDGHVGEDRRRTHRRDRDVARSVRERVADREELVVGLDVVELEVGERALVVRAPVDDAVVAVEVALVPEVDEEAQDRADVGLVHREPLAAVVHRRSHAPELGHDRAAVEAEPLPHARLERLAAELAARAALLLELLLDDALRRDARMVVPGLEERREALHAPPADERVRERELKGVAHVQLARDVRWRERDHVGLARVVSVGRVQALFLPRLLPARLDVFGPVARIHGGGV